MRRKIIASVLLVSCFAVLALAQNEKTARVSGRITTLWGEPIERAQLSFYKLAGMSGNSPAEKFIQQAITDKDGNYKVVVPWGDYRIEIKGRGWGHTEVWRFYLGENDDRILDIGVMLGNWHMIVPMKVSGIVKQPNGAPVADATVTIISAYSYNEPQAFVSFQRRTDSEGKFSFVELEVGDFVVYVAKPGFLPGSTAFRLNNGEEKRIDIEMKVAPKFEFLPKRKK